MELMRRDNFIFGHLQNLSHVDVNTACYCLCLQYETT